MDFYLQERGRWARGLLLRPRKYIGGGGGRDGEQKEVAEDRLKQTNRKEIQREIFKVEWLWLHVTDTETVKHTHTHRDFIKQTSQQPNAHQKHIGSCCHRERGFEMIVGFW